ncbi:MAG: DMT family transporter [Ruminococcaceae bacterium]|nr:DMT family transporter [Oscillospiraceae bacterium]
MKRLIVILGVAATATSAILVRYSTAPSLVLVMYRMLLTVALLAPPTLLKNRQELKALQRRDWLLCAVSGIFIGLHFAAYFEALKWTSIAAAVVLADTEVLFVAFATVLIFRRKLSGKAWIAIWLAFGGSIVIAAAETTAGADPLRGNLLGLVSAMLMAVYTMIGSVCRKRVSTTVYTFLVYGMAGLTVTTVAIFSGTQMTNIGAMNWAICLGLAIFPTLLGHSVFSWGLKYLPPTFISTAKLLEPVLAAVMGWLLFRENPGWQVVVGGVIVVVGIALYGRVEAAEKEEN